MTLYARYVDHFNLKSDDLKATLLISSNWSGYQHKVFWDNNSNEESIGYSTLKTHDYDKTGKYTVKVVSTKGDQTATSTLVINVAAGGSSQGGDEDNDQDKNQYSNLQLILGIIIAIIVAALYYCVVNDDELIAMIAAAFVIVIYYSALLLGVI